MDPSHISPPDQLRDQIDIEIARSLAAAGHIMSEENEQFLSDTLVNHVRTSIHKYIAGSVEHGDDFLTDVAHLAEAQKEIIDLQFYIAGLQHKQQNNT